MAQTHSITPGTKRSFNLDSVLTRISGIVSLRRSTVVSIAADRQATLEAALVVALVGVATSLGYRQDLMVSIVGALIAWAGLSGAIWFIADRLLGTPTSREAFEPILRTVGYALAPVALNVVHFIWGLGPMLAGIGTIWSIVAAAFAIRHTTHFTWPRTIGLTIGGAIAVNILGFFLSIFTGASPHIW